jgi:arsenite methyltransferase
MSDEQPLDHWADWLMSGRQRGAPRIHERRQAAHLRRVRDKVLQGARIRGGQAILDVGTGTGLLALGAVNKVHENGLVVGLDVSEDNLREVRRAAAAGNEDGSVRLVRGDAVQLPLRDASFDAVMTRSVLMYLEDRPRAIEELHRVLKPGGRASIFEAINKVYTAPNVRTDEPALASIHPDHERVVAYLDAHSRYAARMRSFDERDLLREFDQAGFASVSLTYEHHYERGHRSSRWEAVTFLSTRPNPGTISYEEAAHEVLGETADEHLRQFAEILSSARYQLTWAVVYIVAVKSELQDKTVAS